MLLRLITNKLIYFKSDFNKSYATPEEENHRFRIFQENLDKIQTHNARYEAGLETFYMGINQFTDIDAAEFRQSIKKTHQPLPNNSVRKGIKDFRVEDVPESKDWVTEGAVLPIRDQTTNCRFGEWAFSAAAALEGQNFIKNKKSYALSPQQLIDCDKGWNDGCASGDATAAFEYTVANGLSSEDEYPFRQATLPCDGSRLKSNVTASGFVKLDAGEDVLKAAVGTAGPVTAKIYFGPMQHYAGGILASMDCFNDMTFMDFTVLVVGYGADGDQLYWLIKNCWGTTWGEKGYLKLAREANYQCGIGLDCSYPLL
ncbi:unnamed protein product [Phyllotreta striolata]|uniref:Uncharacterized protein n=1 Tax=Phyllotreta striolata TaxID=444603 RepID=A0A9N9XMH3_PHYSR|nr:unnamed protein product [Phyllotreta striolata]